MALDKQRILSELGSVVNQLQSADCGCMGKMFSNSSQCHNNQGNPQPSYGGCGYNYCHGHGHGHHHGWGHDSNAPCAGEPHSGNRHCMGFCNPPKLYADTYNYLNHNLMQPVVKDVYNDLKTITPANTMMNNPIGSQMGMPVQGNAASPGTGAEMMAQNQMSGGNNMAAMGYMQSNANAGMPNMNMDSNNMQMNAHNAAHQKMGGMGPQIMNMIMGEGAKSNGMQNQVSQPSSHMGGEMHQTPYDQGMASTNMAGNGAGSIYGNNNAGYNAASMHSGFNSGQNAGGMYADVNIGQYNGNSVNANANQGQYTVGGTGMSNMGQPMQNMTAQYATQQNMYGSNTAGITMPGNTAMSPQQMTNTAPSPAHQQMAANNQSHAKYGQHSAGIAKFNEMFPGVMQGLGGELGFDPMSIAIQMNPSNQQQAAMDTMNKMMMGNKEGINRMALMQPAINGANAAAASLAQPNHPPATQMQQSAPYQQLTPNAQNATSAYQMSPVHQPGENPSGAVPQQYYQTQELAPPATMVPSQTQQQVYTAVSGAPTLNQQEVPPPQQQQFQQQNQAQLYQQQTIDPNTGRAPVYDGSGDPNTQVGEAPQQYIKEPIFPANVSNRPTFYNMVKPRKQNYDYNTLGQPVQMLPAKMYATPEPDLPQTLSPQMPTRLRQDPNRYSNVKSTISKTSLMGNKPLGKTPSRNQLQHIYNQYRGSQSFTQQNFKPSERTTHSAGDIVQNNAPRQEAIEKFAGDTIYNNNQLNDQLTTKVEHDIGRMGDVPVKDKPNGNIENQASPTRQGRCRNGLQDMVFTSSPTSAAWSFHGNNQFPVHSGYRYRK